VLRRTSDLDLGTMAAGPAFWLLLSVFPAGLVAVNVLGLFVTQEEVAAQIGDLANRTPGAWGELLAQQLLVVAAPSPGTGAYDVALVLLALWTVSNALVSLLRALRRTYGLGRTHAILARSLAAGVGIAMIAIVAILAETVDADTLFGTVVGTVATAALLFVMVLGLMRVALGREQSWRGLVPGAATAAVGLLAVGAALDLYASVSLNLTLVYGRIAGLVVSMLTVWLSVYVVLLGAVLNSVLRDTEGEARP
jgi:membrane protein